MTRRMIGLALCSLVVSMLGCGPSGPKKPPSVDASGTVQIDGQPLPEGEISFMVEGQPPILLPIKDGKFTGKPMAGENRVQVWAHRKGKPIMMGDTPVGEPVKENYADDEFNVNSTLKVNIPPAGSTDLKFEVKSKVMPEGGSP